MTKEQILSTQYSYEFDELRKNRVATSYYKYGDARTNFGAKLVDTISTLELCLAKYKTTGNTEYLLDVANYAMFEYMIPQKDGAYFNATDSGESAGIIGMSVKEIESM